ncbi:MAG: hypothetical protein ACF8SC_07845 [Phycisphaerales bacterium JB037]
MTPCPTTIPPPRRASTLVRRLPAPRVPALLALAAALLLPACSPLSGSARGYEARSIADGSTLSPRFPTAIYRAEDENSAYLYLTDLSPADLRPGAPVDTLTGHIVRVHNFVRPRAGRTPIETTAFTASVTHAVFAQGQIGIYRGGGFFEPDRAPGGTRFGGTLNGGSLRIERATPGFVDRLGSATLQAQFQVRRDDASSALIQARLEELIRAAQPVDPDR